MGQLLGEDKSYHALFDLVLKHCDAFNAREVSNVVRGVCGLEQNKSTLSVDPHLF